MEYPKLFDKCPSCGCEETIAQMEANKEVEAGRMRPGTKLPMIIIQTPLFDAQKLAKIVATHPIELLVSFVDACTMCGTLYCRDVQKQQGIVTNDPNVQKGLPQMPGQIRPGQN